MEQLRVLLADVWQLLRQPMTAGQKQSTLVLVPLILALLFYGRPIQSNEGSSAVAAQTPPVSELRDEPPEPATPPASPQGETSSGPRAPDTTRPPPMPAVSVQEPVDSTSVPAVVALVQPTPENTPPGSDAEMAELFTRREGLTVTTLVLERGDDDLCRSVLAAGELVLASNGIGPGLRTCLVQGGATILAYDALGDVPPGSVGPGQVLSTRRGYVDGLAELARWGVAEGALADAVGLVTMESARDETERALPVLEATGVDVVAVAYLPDDRPTVQILRGALEFAGAGVETTMFAAPVAVQEEWVGQASVVSPDVEYLVSDAFDAVLDPDYSAAFDGSRAVTTLTFPWSPSSSPARRECDQAWSSAGGIELSPRAAVRMYAWCQHAALASTVEEDDGWAAKLRQTSMPSPVTADLGPLEQGGWGPTQDVVLRWRSTCGCWSEDRPFTERTPTHHRS